MTTTFSFRKWNLWIKSSYFWCPKHQNLTNWKDHISLTHFLVTIPFDLKNIKNRHSVRGPVLYKGNCYQNRNNICSPGFSLISPPGFPHKRHFPTVLFLNFIYKFCVFLRYGLRKGDMPTAIFPARLISRVFTHILRFLKDTG